MRGNLFKTINNLSIQVNATVERFSELAKIERGLPLDTVHAIGLALAAGTERWTAMEGGCPVIMGGECIGGIGVSGGSFEFDQRVAREAVESIGASAK